MVSHMRAQYITGRAALFYDRFREGIENRGSKLGIVILDNTTAESYLSIVCYFDLVV